MPASALYTPEIDYRRNYHFELLALFPYLPDKAKIAEGVAKISTNFVKIFNQSLAAESHNLDQLVGIGLRKALEFLIKDYCIHKHPEKAADIKTRLLGQCISITSVILTLRIVLRAQHGSATMKHTTLASGRKTTSMI